MPRLINGRIVAGVGTSVVSVDRRGIADQAGDVEVLDRSRIIYQRNVGGTWILETYDVGTGAYDKASAFGANRLCAGGGVWAARLDPNGSRDSLGRIWPRDNVAGVGPDGTIALVDYASGGGLRLVQPDGQFIAATAAPDNQVVQVLDAKRAVWTEGHRPRALGLTAPVVVEGPVYWLKVASGWVLYQDGRDRLLLHPVDSTVGYLLAAGNTFRPDVAFLPEWGVFRVCWATHEGERPEDLIVRDLEYGLNLIRDPDGDDKFRPISRVDLRVTPPSPPKPPKPPEPRTMQMPDRVKGIVQEIYARNVALAEGSDDDRRALIKLVAEQVCFELGLRWGTKRADPGRPPSKDAIAYNAEDGRLYSADCFNGTTRKPSVPNVLDDITGQVFIAVSPVDHLGAVVEPPKPPEPPPTVDLSAIYAKLAQLEAENAALKANVESLRQLVTQIDLATVRDRIEQLEGTAARIGQPISVKGSVTFREALYGSKVVWRGELGKDAGGL